MGINVPANNPKICFQCWWYLARRCYSHGEALAESARTWGVLLLRQCCTEGVKVNFSPLTAREAHQADEGGGTEAQSHSSVLFPRCKRLESSVWLHQVVKLPSTRAASSPWVCQDHFSSDVTSYPLPSWSNCIINHTRWINSLIVLTLFVQWDLFLHVDWRGRQQEVRVLQTPAGKLLSSTSSPAHTLLSPACCHRYAIYTDDY